MPLHTQLCTPAAAARTEVTWQEVPLNYLSWRLCSFGGGGGRGGSDMKKSVILSRRECPVSVNQLEETVDPGPVINQREQ